GVAGGTVPGHRAPSRGARARLARAERARGRRRRAGQRARLPAPVAHGDLRVGRELLPPLLLPPAEDLRVPQGDGERRRALPAPARRGRRVRAVPGAPSLVGVASFPRRSPTVTSS